MPAHPCKPAAYTTDAADTSVPRAAQTHEKYERLIAQAKGISRDPDGGRLAVRGARAGRPHRRRR